MSPPAGILCFFMATTKRASGPAPPRLLGKAAQVCFQLALTRFSLRGGVRSPPSKLGIVAGPMSLEELGLKTASSGVSAAGKHLKHSWLQGRALPCRHRCGRPPRSCFSAWIAQAGLRWQGCAACY